MTVKEALELALEMLEKAYNKNENFSGFYNFKTNEKFTINDISQYITKALTELEAIKSADGNEALNALNIVYGNNTDIDVEKEYEIIGNFILKSQAQEREIEKKDKLLKLYRECNEEGYFWLEIQQRIKALEEELK